MYKEVETYQGVLDDSTISNLLSWVSDNDNLFRHNGEGRRILRLQDTDSVFDNFKEIEGKLKSLIKHEGLIPNHALGDIGNLFCYQTEGASTDVHTDDYHEGYKTVRVNTTISAPEGAGRLIVEGEPIDAKVGTTLVFYPSEVEHWSEPVIGKTPRITLSIAYCFLV